MIAVCSALFTLLVFGCICLCKAYNDWMRTSGYLNVFLFVGVPVSVVVWFLAHMLTV